MTAALCLVAELAQSAAPPDALDVHVHVWHLPTKSNSSSSSAASVASSTASASRPDPTTSTTPNASTATSKPKPKFKSPSHQSTLNIAKRPKATTETQERVVAAMDTNNKLIVSLVIPTTPTNSEENEDGETEGSNAAVPSEMSFPLRLAPFPVINTTGVITCEGKIATSRDTCKGKILVVNGRNRK